jgi:hypothetical protein
MWARVVLIAAGDEVVAAWPVSGAGRPDIGTVDLLARMQLAAARLGWSLVLRDACPDLVRLLDLAGLGHVVRIDDEPPGQPG